MMKFLKNKKGMTMEMLVILVVTILITIIIATIKSRSTGISPTVALGG
jgi:competence protein ComGC